MAKKRPKPDIGQDDLAADPIRQLIGPGRSDIAIRQAIMFCWTGLPKERTSLDEVERQVRRIVDRALRDMRDDFEEFFGKASTE